MEFLQRIYFNNSLEDYLWFIGSILLVLVINRYIAKVLGMLLYRIFRGFSTEDLGTQFNDLLMAPIKRIVLVLTVYFAFLLLEYPDILDFEIYGLSIQGALHKVIQFLMALAVTWIGLRIVDFVGLLLLKQAEKTEGKMDDQLIPFIKDFFKVVFVIFSFFFILNGILGVNITGLMAGIGIGGLAIALAAQQSLENLLGSFTIFLDKPFVVGDFIQVGDVQGVVEKVGFRSTRIRTIEKSFVTLPNKMIVDSTLDNLTLRTFRRVRFLIGVTYDTSNEQIEAIVKDIQKYLDDHSNTNEDGIVGFYEFGDNSLNILVQYYADHSDWATFVKLKEEVNFRIMDIVKKHGSDFAFPTRTIHLVNEGGNSK